MPARSTKNTPSVEPAQSPEELRGTNASQRAASAVSQLARLYEKETFHVPFPFARYVLGIESRDGLPPPPREALLVMRTLRQQLKEDRADLLAGKLRGEAFLRYIAGLREASALGSGKSCPDLAIDLLLRVTKPAQTQSPLPHTHHFSQTSVSVVPRLVQLGEIMAADHVMDLGCGNARLLLLLTMATGCRGVGVEILPRLAAQGNALAQRNRTAIVTTHAGNALTADLSESTVVVMYAPFYAAMYERMIGKLEARARHGNFRVLIHGPMEPYLDRSPVFRTHPESGSVRRYDAIPELEGSSLERAAIGGRAKL